MPPACPIPLHEGDPAPRDLAHRGLEANPHEAVAQAVLARPAPPDWRPTGATADLYLDLAEGIVRAAAGWQDATGAIIDPVMGAEHGQTSSRYAAPGAILLAAGRIPDLADSVYRTMDYACARLADGEATGPDFWMRELTTALLCLRTTAPAERIARWEADLRRVAPETTYMHVSSDPDELAAFHNIAIYAAAGESIRARLGLAPDGTDVRWGDAYFEKYVEPQFGHFNRHGQYRDPNDPITYDITTRLQVVAALAFGYAGPLRADCDELLRRAGWTTLLMVTEEGHAPYGGRSGQFQFQEAILAALCEWEARRHRDGAPAWAGAFKRQARRSALATRRWLTGMHPHRHIKNAYPPEASFGRDGYGHYSVYSLLAASFFGLATLYADETIGEAPCPAELGGYAVSIEDGFHKVFARGGALTVEADTCADRSMDATGLGRIHRPGVPLELGPGMPIAGPPKYLLPDGLAAERPAALAPVWTVGGTRHRLAACADHGPPAFAVETATPERTAYVLTYRLPEAGGVTLRERAELAGDWLAYRVTVEPLETGNAAPEAVGLEIPILVTDGEAEATVTLEADAAVIAYRGASWRAEWNGLRAHLDETQVANRNGVYRLLLLEGNGADLAVRIRLTP